MPADGVADRLPDAVHPRARRARATRPRPGRGRRRRDRADRARARGGLRVWATGRSEEKRARALELGADAGVRARRAAARARRRGDGDGRRGDLGALAARAQAGRDARRLAARRAATRRRPSSTASSSCSSRSSARRWARATSSSGSRGCCVDSDVRPVIDRSCRSREAREGFAALLDGDVSASSCSPFRRPPEIPCSTSTRSSGPTRCRRRPCSPLTNTLTWRRIAPRSSSTQPSTAGCARSSACSSSVTVAPSTA